MTGYVLLEDGTVYEGRSVAAPGVTFGEAVFTTAMTGYQETVTDPSYAEQIVCFTAAMVGNYGVDPDRDESSRPHAKAVLMRRLGGEAWAGWLAERGIVALDDVDTRALVVHLRSQGAMRAAVVGDETELSADAALELVRAEPLMAGRGLVEQVAPVEPYTYAETGRIRVALVDYGTKRSILRRLECAGASVTVHPPTVDADVLAEYDGVLLANGPGDPEPLRPEVEQIERLLGRTSILGICLGHQLLGLATGHRTYKLPFGHRGANHPVLERATGRVLVTSQNHGFAVAPSDASEASYVSLYDGTVEGLDFPDLDARSVQFHPEASPGTHDAYPVLERWVDGLLVGARG